MFFRFSLLLLFLLVSITGRSQYFDARYVNSAKEMRLQGKLKELKQIFYKSSENDLQKKEVEYSLLYRFNEVGNLSEKLQFRANGEEVSRETFEYVDGKMFGYKKFSNGGLFPEYIVRCVTDVAKNTFTGLLTIPGVNGVLSTFVRGYNAKGELILQSRTESGNTTGFTRIYDAAKNVAGNTSFDKESGFDEIFDKNKFLVETRYYKVDNKVHDIFYKKYDAYGNIVESFFQASDGQISSKSINRYTYDEYNNWIMKTIKSESPTRWEEQVITYR